MLIFLSPVAGYFADTKFSRFKVLMCSTHLMTASVTLLLLLFFMFTSFVHDVNIYLTVFLIGIGIMSVAYYCGYIFFVANIIQFGTDQLRDAPTQYSVLFVHAYLWCDNFSSALTSLAYLPNHEVFI